MVMVRKMSLLYKIMTRQEWADALARRVYEGSELDRKDGFIHLSAPHQVRETAAKHFAGKADLVLLVVIEASLGKTLKWETSRGGALFPHIYGPLPLSAVKEAVLLPFKNGMHQFPESLEA
jgi:uncharacterized protein (DUF952 family)